MRLTRHVAESIGWLVVGAAIGLGTACSPDAPTLTVYLRCEARVGGTLLLTLPSSESAKERRLAFEVDRACAAGKVELPRYRMPTTLHFTLQRSDGPPAEGAALYGRDIQSDQNGYYTVLSLSEAPPYARNDRI